MSTITQKEIAQSLGVSRGTVKFALNGNGKLSSATRERVLQQAERMGYDTKANMNARMLAAKRNGGTVRTYAIAVLCVRWPDGRSPHTMPFFLPFWEGVEEAALARGYEVALYLHRDGQLPRLLRDGDVDGVILLTPPGHGVMQHISKPIVSLGSFKQGTHNVVPDSSQGMKLAVEHLLGQGHRRIAYLGGEPTYHEGVTRMESVVETLKAAGCFHPELMEATVPGITPEVTRAGLQRLLARTRDFTGLVCYNDALAAAAIDVMVETGVRVPEDVSVIGFDNIKPDSRWGQGLTSIGFDAHGMGQKAVQIIAGGEQEEPVTELFPVTLVERASTQHQGASEAA